MEKKEILLKTAEVSNTELKNRLKAFEKENKELIKKLNDEFLSKKLDFEEIIKQSIEALKIFYAKFEANVNNNLNENFYFDIIDNIDNPCYSNINNNYYFNLEINDKSNKTNNKNSEYSLNSKNPKSPYNIVAFDNEDFDWKSSNSKYDRMNRNRSLCPIGKKDNYSSNFLSKSNNRREKFSNTNIQKRSKSNTNEKTNKLNLQNLSFLKNDIFNFEDFFEKMTAEQINFNKSNNDYNASAANNYFNSSTNKKNNTLNRLKSSFNNVNNDNNKISENLNGNSNYPLKIIIEQALLSPINYKINQKNILRGNLQAFNFYFNFLKSELFSSLLRESNTANFIKTKLTPILKEYAEDGDFNPLKHLSDNLENQQKNLMENFANAINDLKNKLNNEIDSKNILQQEIKSLQAEKQNLNNQLEELEANLNNLSAIETSVTPTCSVPYLFTECKWGFD